MKNYVIAEHTLSRGEPEHVLHHVGWLMIMDEQVRNSCRAEERHGEPEHVLRHVGWLMIKYTQGCADNLEQRGVMVSLSMCSDTSVGL